MIRRPPRSTLDRSSAASDVYKRQVVVDVLDPAPPAPGAVGAHEERLAVAADARGQQRDAPLLVAGGGVPVSYTHLRAHETVLDLVCRLLLEKKKTKSVPTTASSHCLITA